MDNIFSIILAAHIIGGSIGLLSGSVNIIAKKGGRQHKFVGRLFVIAMLIAGLSALVLSVLHPNQFLFMVGIFTVYMVGTGARYLHLKNRHNQKPRAFDWFLTLLMLLAGILFFGLGVLSLSQSNLFGLVYITFSFFGLLFVRNDIKNYRRTTGGKNYWLSGHLQRMTGAYIASSTAFLVVNANYLPAFIPMIVYWLLPTIVLTPLIIKWAGKYESNTLSED